MASPVTSSSLDAPGGGYILLALFFVFLVVSALICCIPAAIARRKGRSFWGFWFIAMVVPFGFWIMLIIALAIAEPVAVVPVVRVQPQS